MSSSSNKGFTLVELLVVVAIFVFTTGIVLANLPAFRDKTALDLLAEEIAVTIRSAQVYGVSTRVFGPPGSQAFPSHGIHFDPPDPSNPSASFVLFADLGSPPDNVYTPSPPCGQSGTECREQFFLHGGVVIAELVACSDSACSFPTTLSTLDIIFARPEPDARFTVTPSVTTISHVKITIKSIRSGDTRDRDIVVWTTGHIYAENPNS